MLVKSLKANHPVKHQNTIFRNSKEVQNDVKPLKNAFEVASEKFLCYIVDQRVIETNLKKIKALIDMKSHKKPEEIQSLTWQVAVLSRFVLKTTNRCLPFFKNS